MAASGSSALAPEGLAQVSASPATPAVATLAEVLPDPTLQSDRNTAFTTLYSRWGLAYHGTAGGFWCESGRREAVQCLLRTGTWNKLRRFNLPAIIELVTPTGDKHYATVTALGEESATLAFGDRQVTFPVSEIDRFWDGPHILLWKPPALSAAAIQPGMRSKDVVWLRQRLSDLDGTPLAGKDPNLYDDALKERVIAFQLRRLLRPDGIVGEETLTHLSTASHDPGIPWLSSPAP